MGNRSAVVLAGLLVVTSGCGRGRRAADDMSPASNPVRVNVTNNSSMQMEIYAEGSGTSYRMGLVAPGIVGHFVLRSGMVGNGLVEFLAQPTAAGEPVVRSGPLQLSAGNIVDFEITTQLISSHAAVRP